MTGPKPISEIVVDVGTERTDSAQALYGKAIRPIYTQLNGRPAMIGTCVLVRTPIPVMLTAAHVVDNTYQTGTYVAGHTDLVETPGEWMTTQAPPGGRKDDALDFAIMALTPERVKNLGADDFVTIDDFEQAIVPSTGQAYCCLGYPRSKNKKIKPGNVLPTFCYRFWSTSGGFKNPRPGHFRDDTHLMIKHDEERVGTASGEHVNPPDLHGMSGGLMVHLFDAQDPSSFVPGGEPGKIVGLNIEYHARNTAIVAVRSHILRAALASWPRN